MPNYAYRAIDDDGRIRRGHIDAANERALESRLRQAGAELIRCQEQKRGGRGRWRSVSRKDLIGFCFHMEQSLRAGLPIIESLTDMRDSVEHEGFREILANLVSSVEGGRELSQAMQDYPKVFDEVFVSLVAVGEQTGELAEVMRKMTLSLKWHDEIMSKAKTVISGNKALGNA